MIKTLNRLRLLVIAAGWVLALLRAQAAETSLIAFELDSHDEQTYTESSWAGRPLMVVVSSREAAPHNAGMVWSLPLTAAITAVAPDVALVRVATLPGGVPRIFAGTVRNAIAPVDGDPIRVGLLDWEGVFAERYVLRGDSYNVLVFDRRGKLVFDIALQAFNQAQLDTVLGEFQALAGQL